MNIIRLIYTLSLVFLTMFTMKVNSQVKSEYVAAIESGDKHYSEGDYIRAKTSYQYAARLKPEEDYPKEKLNRTLVKLRERMALVDEYTRVITEADQYLRENEYDYAIAKYQEAASIIPSEGYPEEKIEEIRRLKDQAKKNRFLYDDAIYRGDKFVKYRKYEEALEQYNIALELFPTESYPREKIKEIESQLAELVSASNEYDAVIANADRLYSLKYYDAAKAEYQKALDARPDEEYPASQIVEMDKMLVKKNEFDNLIAEADEFYMNKELEKAKEKYQESLSIYPSESYPQDMIEKINTGLKKQFGKSEAYQKSIANGDNFLKEGDYTNALQEYQNAVDLKPNESYPQLKIDEIERILEQKERNENLYTLAVKAGDQFLNAESYAAAKEEFEKALKLKPGATYPQDRLAMVNEVLKEQEAIMASYNINIDKAAALAEEGKFDEAKDEYKKALVILPDDQYAKDQMLEMDNLKKQMIENKAEYEKVIVEADKLYDRKDYSGARVKYVDAARLDPDQSHPVDRIAEIDQYIVEQQKINDQYARIIATADIFYNKKEYERAQEEYQKAVELKPNASHPQNRLGKIAAMSTTAITSSQGDEYTEAIKKGDEYFGLMQYDEAKKSYMKASNLRPKEQYPKDKLNEIDQLVTSQAATIAQYNKQVSAGDRMMEAGDYEKARERYNQALAIFPREQYPQEKIEEIDKIILSDEIAAQESFNQLISEADKLFEQQQYEKANIKYRAALKIKPEEGYPQQQLSRIEELSIELDKEEDKYSRIIAEADMLFTSKEYQEAKSKYIEASELFPGEEHPKTRIEEINLIFKAQNQSVDEEYATAIADADKFFASGTYVKAMDSYRQAKKIKPDESYPDEMIADIEKILNENAMRNLVNASVTVNNNQEEKFSFDPLSDADRRSSILIIKAKGIASRNFKVFVNYGRGGSKNGGYILPITPSDDENEYVIPLGKQNKWFSEDNNWIKITPQGGSVDISVMKIAKE